ncbi:MAG TPA: phosphate acyltransferase PlsX [Phycisphaerales bacterium]|nr:phosphate acyltransferase PlsX [Phycisphaerales bacterium]
MAQRGMRVGIDIMGGDHAPDAIIKGCVMALPDLPAGDTLVLVGPEGLIREMLAERAIKTDDPRIEVVDAPDVIEMGDSAAKAVRQKTESSIVRMHQMGGAGHPRRCDVVLSAGNTGACVAAAMLHMRRLPNVLRPGIAVTIPAFNGPFILTDAGANPEPKAEHLWQYGVMADAMARLTLGLASPRVGLMNIGSEEAKGTGIIKETRDLLKATPGLNYIGYVEGRDLFEGVADVVVTDGLVGNTVLKAAEGMAKSLFKAIGHELLTQDAALLPRFEPVVKAIYAKNDYHEHGGAPLLGVNGACFIAHGSSEARTIRAAIRNCRNFVRLGVNEAVVRRLAEVAPVLESVVEPKPERARA